MKLCKDCKHHQPKGHGDGEFDKCAAAAWKTDAVTGEKTMTFGSYGYCKLERDVPFPFDILLNCCGKRARRFESAATP